MGSLNGCLRENALINFHVLFLSSSATQTHSLQLMTAFI